MRYGILGPLEVRDGDTTILLAQGRQRLLLAALLLTPNQPVSTDVLIDALWGEGAPPKALGGLHNLVSALRKTLGADRLVTRDGGYALRVGDDELDASRFAELVGRGRTALAGGDPDGAAALLGEALGLWRGPALGDLAYEPALAGEVARLEEDRLTAVEERIEADLTLGRHTELIGELDALVAAHPLRERFAEQQMLALYRCGRQADALRVYAEARERLVHELGIEPGPGLQRLQGAVLAQDPALRPPDRLPPPSRSKPPALAGAARHPRAIALAGVLMLASTATIFVAARPHDGRGRLAAASGSALAEIDPASNRVVAAFPVGGTPTGVAVSGTAIWALNGDEQTVSRIDRSTHATTTFSTGALPVDIAVSADALWLLLADPPGAFGRPSGVPATLARLDPASLLQRSSTRLGQLPGPECCPTPPGLVAVGSGAAWAVGSGGRIYREDVGDGRVRQVTGLHARHVATGDGQVWIDDGAGRLVELDPATGRPIARVAVPASDPTALAVGAGAVWLTDAAAGTVWRVGPGPVRDVRTITVAPGVDSLAVGSGAVWVGNSVGGTITRIDPGAGRVTATITVANTPRALAVGGGRVWVSTAGGGDPLPAAGALRSGARITPLSAPPCGPVLTGPGGDPDVIIASDMPLQGATIQTLAGPVVDAISFALRLHRFRAGRFRIGYQSCDDSTAQSNSFEPAKCASNARAYARDPSVVGVIGPLNSGCALAMLPILNRARPGPLALVSPTNSDPALVRRDPAAPAGTLRRLYPTGQRGYARVFPADDYEAAAGALLAKRLGRGSVFYIDDEFNAPGPWSAYFRRAAGAIGLHIAGTASIPVPPKHYRRLGQRVRASGAHAVYLNASVAWPNSGALLRDLRATLGPNVPIIGSGQLLPIALLFKWSGSAARGVYVTSAGRPVTRLTAPGKRFVHAFAATQAAGRVPATALYAAAAVDVMLDAIGRSDGTRASVTRVLAATRLSATPLGPVAFDRHGEPRANPITIVRADHGGADPALLGLAGSVPTEVITPSPELAGPGAGR